MKKVHITLLLVVMLAITVFASGCSNNASEFDYSTPEAATLSYTVFTDGDYTYNIYSDHAELVDYAGKSRSGLHGLHPFGSGRISGNVSHRSLRFAVGTSCLEF